MQETEISYDDLKKALLIADAKIQFLLQENRHLERMFDLGVPQILQKQVREKAYEYTIKIKDLDSDKEQFIINTYRTLKKGLKNAR